jgi:rRNA maturation protein Nop10
MDTVQTAYPAWVCFPCGRKYGRGMPAGHLCTVHTDICDICGEETSVTEPRDFGHLKPGWRLKEKYSA